MRYEIASLSIRPRTAPQVLAGVQGWLSDGQARGRLLGCWTTDIGDLNRVLLLRQFATDADLTHERLRAFNSSNIFGAADALRDVSFETYLPAPFQGLIEPGAWGPIYEIRTYGLKFGALDQALSAWRDALPQRTRLSPIIATLVAIEGSPRFTHIWAYRDIEQRSSIREKARQDHTWPPKELPTFLTGDMQSTIAIPTAFSPLA